MTRVYVSGPMTGLKDFNRAAFEHARAFLEAPDVEVVDPVSEDIRVYGSWEAAVARPWQEHLARDVAMVPTCDEIVCLPGWSRSSGATLEVRVARALKMPIAELRTYHREGYLPEYMLYALSPDEVNAILSTSEASIYPTLEATERSRGVADVAIDDHAIDAPGEGLYEGERFVPYAEDPKRHVFGTGGIKDNRGKAPIDLVPSKPIAAIAKILAFGAIKYQPHNWRKGLPWPDTYSSLQRHLLAWNDGEDLDPETGESHLAHAGCQLMFLLDYVLTGVGKETDNRFNAPKPEAT